MTSSYRILACALIASAALSGCANLSPSSLSLPSIPPPSFDWLTGGPNKPGPLPVPKGGAAASIVWQANVGKAGSGIAPAITTDAVYAAASDGSLTRIDPASGHVVWRVNAGHPLSAGPGADTQIVVVGTDQGLVLAFDAQGKALWTAQVSSMVTAPPLVSDKVVIVFSGDGRIYGLAAADGKTLWVDPRTLPSLTVRNAAGGVVSRGGVFVGTAGGQLLAIAAQTGALGWDATVAVPKGSTELERIADVTSLPFVDENEACAAAFQGRVACFDVVRGTLLWTRDISSLAGITGDAKRLYVVDDNGNVQALDRSNGASIWKQDVLAKRHIGGPQIIGDDIGVVDIEGYLHLLSRNDGTYLARLATDGTAATAQPSQYGGGILWQSKGGNVYSVSAR
ncbi:MAG TPA: outer membrane protein assembly factor BamB [Casimicrobiaceae bacterium]|nr:outer membrane protein assembly factor BamB [Casimicrobiaceae bacterium]